MSEQVKIIEKEKIPSGATLLFGFPDVGLVGLIAASHLVDELNMTEVAYVESTLLPPLIVLHEGLPHYSMRILAGDHLLLAVSEVPIPTDTIYPIMDALIEWGRSKNVKMMISLSGLPIEERQDATELKGFAAASNPEALKIAKDNGIEVLMEGYMVGPQAVVLQRASKYGSPALALLAQCFYNYPDPEAAAEVLKELAKITGVKVNVAKLLEKGEEIRLRARDVMKRTQQEMSKMKKGQEYDIPMYVS
ncbi:proteasome assembly chaperone family protein [Candidatus Bathyarchaeota archaeon]|nr:proteasome assembly chaperone family protein [Candidatus Bathyarchaeota archaeon]